MKLLFERSIEGRKLDLLPKLDVKQYNLDSKYLRNTKLSLCHQHDRSFVLL